MLVSVVIPTWNRPAMTLRAVESVLAQTRRELECIVVDDGSQVDVAALLHARCKDPRLRVVRQENQGVSAARNRGLALAQGEIFALLDSDDYWLEDKLQKQVHFMRDRGFAICQTQEIWRRKGKRVNPMRKHAKQEGDFFAGSVRMCLISPSCVAFTPALWADCGPFDVSLPACEDYDLWLRVCARHPVGLVDELLAVREGGRPDQLSQRYIGQDLYRIYALARLLRTEPLGRNRREVALRELGRKVRVYVQGCIKRDKPEEALRIRALTADLLGPAAGSKNDAPNVPEVRR